VAAGLTATTRGQVEKDRDFRDFEICGKCQVLPAVVFVSSAMSLGELFTNLRRSLVVSKRQKPTPHLITYLKHFKNLNLLVDTRFDL